MQQHSYGATGKAGLCRVSPAGKDGGNAGAEDDAGQLCAAQVLQLLGQHIATFEVGDDQDVGLAGNRRNQPLDLGCLDADCGIECQWSIENAAGNLAAVGHLAQSCRIQCGLDLGV